MTRYKFSNEETFHVFASRSQDHGESFHGSVFFENDTLYSYGRHFPICRWHGDKLLWNADSYSVTTSKHQSQASYACNHIEKIYLPDLDKVVRIMNEPGKLSKIGMASKLIESYAAQIETIEDSITRMRADHKKESARNEIAGLESASSFVWHDICKRRGNPLIAAGKVNAKAKKDRDITRFKNYRFQLENALRSSADEKIERIEKLESIQGLAAANRDLYNTLYNRMTHVIDGSAKVMGKAWVKEYNELHAKYCIQWEKLKTYQDAMQERVDALRAKENAEKVTAWLDGESVRLPFNLPMMLRVKGDVLETSKGATVPLADAIKLTKIAAICRVKKTGWQRNGEKHPVGMYQTDRITENGDLIVGCHNIPWKAIQACVTRFMPDLVLATD